MAAIWLWEAPGAESRRSGVCGERAQAQAHGEAFLLAGEAERALVEEAVLGDGPALEPCYRRTGRAWRASAGGPVEWSLIAA